MTERRQQYSDIRQHSSNPQVLKQSRHVVATTSTRKTDTKNTNKDGADRWMDRRTNRVQCIMRPYLGMPPTTTTVSKQMYPYAVLCKHAATCLPLSEFPIRLTLWHMCEIFFGLLVKFVRFMSKTRRFRRKWGCNQSQESHWWVNYGTPNVS